MPDTLIAKNREWIGVFNNGVVQAIELIMPGRFQSIKLMRTPLDQFPNNESNLPNNITQPHLPDLYFGVGQDTDFENIALLARDPKVLIVQFDTTTMDIFQVILIKKP